MANLVRQNYLKRDFQSIRDELVNLLKVYYPDQWQDFNAASAGMSLIDLMAYVSDLLSYYTDKRFNELFLDGVTERTSVFRLAKTLGFKIHGYNPAITLCDVIVEVPTTADGPDESYLPIYYAGLQAVGGGQVFETVNDIDFSSDFSEYGTANRKIEPIFNANQNILRYRITKRELFKAGITKIYSKEITQAESNTAFLEITLPDTNVLEIVSIITKPLSSNNSQPTYEDYNDFDIRYFEVDYLAQSTVFVEDDTVVRSVNDVHIGKNQQVSRRFIKEFMSDGTCKITFGGGNADTNAYEDYLTKLPIGEGGDINVSQTLDNDALGVKLPSASMLYIKYRAGGGQNSNVASGVLTQVSNINVLIAGASTSQNNEVVASTRLKNIIPAVGGLGLPTVDEIKYYISSNYASQDRAVTLNDYISRAYQIPGKFGAPFRIHGYVEDNKVKMFILTRDSDGKVSNISSNTIKQNLANYLLNYRMLNDFIEINDGKVVDLSMEIDIFTDKNYNTNEIKASVLSVVKDFFNIEKWQMNQHIYVSQITDLVREVSGVINVVDVRFFNMEGGNYSNILVEQADTNREPTSTRGIYRTQITYIDNAIYSTPISIFQVRYPDTDIMVRVS